MDNSNEYESVAATDGNGRESAYYAPAQRDSDLQHMECSIKEDMEANVPRDSVIGGEDDIMPVKAVETEPPSPVPQDDVEAEYTPRASTARCRLSVVKGDPLWDAHLLSHTFQVQAAFILHGNNPLNTEDGIVLFSLIDTDHSGEVTYEEMLALCDSTADSEAHQLVRKYNDTPLSHLESHSVVQMLFDKIDVDKSGGISEDEWKAFLGLLMTHDHNYLRRKGLTANRVFWGKGREQDLSLHQFTSSVCIDSGYFHDFWYFQKNNHPILGIFLADPDNPLSKLEHFNIEFCTNSWNLLFSAVVFKFATDNKYVYLYSLLLVTIPVIIIRSILLLLFTCPCLQSRNNFRTYFQTCCNTFLWDTGRAVGTLCFLCGIGILILGIFLALRCGKGFVASWLFSWGMSYVLCIFSDLAFKFNPFYIFVMIRENNITNILTLGSLRILNVGQWLIDRRFVLEELAKKERSQYSRISEQRAKRGMNQV